MAFGWVVAAAIMAITIIGLPWARAAFNIAAYTLLPFGSEEPCAAMLDRQSDIGTGPLGLNRQPDLAAAGGVGGWRLAHIATAVVLAVTNYRHPLRLGSCEARRHSHCGRSASDCASLESDDPAPHPEAGYALADRSLLAPCPDRSSTLRNWRSGPSSALIPNRAMACSARIDQAGRWQIDAIGMTPANKVGQTCAAVKSISTMPVASSTSSRGLCGEDFRAARMSRRK